MRRTAFRQCVRKLEPDGRIAALAVSVANLGRRSYRFPSTDVIAILQDRQRLLQRGEVIRHKTRSATGSRV